MKSWRMLGWLFLAQLMVAFVGRGLGPLAPFIGEDFHLSKSQVGWMPAALLMGQSIASLPAGWYVDRLGTRKMILILPLILGVFFLVSSFSLWYPLVLLSFLLGGIGYGAMHPASNRGILDWFELRVRGTAMGIKQMAVTLGSALAALLLIPLATYYEWRGAISIASLCLLVTGIVSFVFYKDAMNKQDTTQNHHFSFIQQVKKLSTHKPLMLVSIAAMAFTGAQFSFLTYLIFYLSDELLFSLTIAASLLSLSEIGASIGRITWGVISDRIFSGKRVPVLVLTAILTACCSITMAFFPPKTNFILLASIVFLFGFSVTGFNGIWMNMASESVPKSFSGIASGFSVSIGSLGVLTGPPVFGWMADFTGGFKMSWILLSCEMFLVVILLSWANQLLYRVDNREKFDAVNL